MVYSVSCCQSKFDLLKCGTQRGHVSNRSGTFKVGNLRATLSLTTHHPPYTAHSLSYHSQWNVHVLQRFTTNYWVLSESHIAPRGGEASRVAQSLSAYMDLGLLAAMLRMWMVDCGQLRMCGCRHWLTVPPPPTPFTQCAQLRCWCGVVIEPENYIFQAIFTPSLMADVRQAQPTPEPWPQPQPGEQEKRRQRREPSTVCGQQWNNLLLPTLRRRRRLARIACCRQLNTYHVARGQR